MMVQKSKQAYMTLVAPQTLAGDVEAAMTELVMAASDLEVAARA